MLIVVDPPELAGIAEVLRAGGAELADVGSQLRACVSCPMPTDIGGVVDQLVSATDRVLDASALALEVWARDLDRRAGIAFNDPIGAVSSFASPSAAGDPYAMSGATFVGGDNGPDWTIVGGSGSFLAASSATVGGNPFGGPTIVGGSGSFLAASSATVGGNPFGGPTILGGSGSFLASQSSDAISTGIIGPTIVGGPAAGALWSGPASGVMALAQTAQNFRERAQARIDRIVRNPNSSPAEIRIALNAQGGLGASLSHVLAPSRQELENKYGPLSESDIRAISPHTLSEPTNLFEGVSLLG